jgi:hypothetical protein
MMPHGVLIMTYETRLNVSALESALAELLLESTIGARGDESERHTFQVPAKALCNAALLECIRYGFQRKLNDRIGGSDLTTKAKVEELSLWLPAFIDGTWKAETKARASGVSLEVRFGREIAKKAIIAKDKSKLNGLKGDDLTAYLDKVLAANVTKWQVQIDKLVADHKAQAAMVASLVDDIEL